MTNGENQSQNFKKVADETSVPTDKVNISENSSHKTNAPISSKRIIILAILLVLVVAGISVFYLRGSSKNSDTVRAAEFDKAGKQASTKGDFKTAESNYYAELKITKDSKTLSNLLNAIASQGNQTGTELDAFKLAKPLVDWGVKTYPKDPDVLLSVGYVYETAGQYNEALNYYTQATQLVPNSDMAWFHLGHVNEFLGKTDDAQRAYDKAYSLNPNNPLVLMVRGNELFSQGRLQDAFELFEKSSNQPNIPTSLKAEALTAASIARRNQENFKYMGEAVTLSKNAVQVNPNFSPALAAYGLNLAMTNNQDLGIEYLKKAMTANPRISDNYYELAIVYRVRKDYGNSINFNKIAIEKIANDNTILGESRKKTAKGKYIYDLAKTESTAYPNLDMTSYFADAINLDPKVKFYLNADIKNGNFNNFVNNSKFLDLLK